VIGAIDFLPNVPEMPHAACRQRGMAALFDRASTGAPDEVARAIAVCRGCPERPIACSSFAAAQSPKDLRALGVVAGRDYTTPPKRGRSVASESSQDGPGRTKPAGVV
jgi:hypothetical protein